MVAQVGNIQSAQSRTTTYGTSGYGNNVTGGMLSSATGAASGASYSSLFLTRRSLETLGLPVVGQNLDDTQVMEVEVEVASVIGASIKEKLKWTSMSERSTLGKVLSFISAVDAQSDLYEFAAQRFADSVSVQSIYTAGIVTASSSSAEIGALSTATSALVDTKLVELAAAQSPVDAAQSDVDVSTSALATAELALDAAQTAVTDYTDTHFDQTRASTLTDEIAALTTSLADLQTDVTDAQTALDSTDPTDTNALAAAQVVLTTAQDALSSAQTLLASNQAALILENAKPAIVQVDLDALTVTLAANTALRDTAAADLAAKEVILTAATASRDLIQSDIDSLTSEIAALDALQALARVAETGLDDYLAALINLENELTATMPKIDIPDSSRAKGSDNRDTEGVETGQQEVVRSDLVEELKQMARRYEDSRLLDLVNRIVRGEKLTEVIADKRLLAASLGRIRDQDRRRQDIGATDYGSSGTLGRNNSVSLEKLPDAPQLGRANITPFPVQATIPRPERKADTPPVQQAGKAVEPVPMRQPLDSRTPDENRSRLQPVTTPITDSMPAPMAQVDQPSGIPKIAIAADAIAALNPRSFQMQDFLGAMEGLKSNVTNRDMLVPLSRLDETAQRKIAEQFISFSQNLKAAMDASNEIFELLKKRENPNPAGRIRVEM